MESSGELLGIQLYGLHRPTDSIICYGGRFDLYSIGYFKRGTAREFLEFAGRNLARAHRNSPSIVRASVNEADGAIHLYGDEDKKVIAVGFTQGSYAQRIVHKMLESVVGEFKKNYWEFCAEVPPKDLKIKYDFLKEVMKNYKKPETMDKIAQLDGKLEEIKVIMHKNLEAALAQVGELEDLVKTSNELSSMSKMFYKDIKEQTDKRCCTIQ